MMITSRDDDAGGRDPHPDLVALNRHELSNDDALEAGDHLAHCLTCRGDLAELVVGASLMGRAARTLASSAPTGSAPSTLPPLPPYRRRTLPRDRWLLTAAAVVVLGALGAVTVGLVGADDPTLDRAGTTTTTRSTPPASPARSVRLAAVQNDPGDTGQPGGVTGQVLMSAGEAATSLTFLTEGLPQAGNDEFYEAWLLDPATDKMLPLGLVSGASGTTFEVANSLLGSYGALDLSLEADDGDPQHSATSVLRGTY